MRLLRCLLSACSLLAASPVRAETGVTEKEVLLGQAAAFTGPSAGLGVEFWRGASAAFAEANAKGGVQSRSVRLVLADDAYEASQAAPAVVKLVSKDQVFALFGGVGTPTMVKALPVVLNFHNKTGLFYFSNVSGAQPQRELPYFPAIFNVRASYREELQAVVDALVASGRTRIGLYLQDDAFGASGRDGAQRALKSHQLTVTAEATYPHGQKFEVSVAEQVRILREAKVQAVISVGSYQAAAAFIRDARAGGLTVPIHNVSFVGAEQMLRLLLDAEKASGKTLTSNLLITQVVPGVDDTATPLVAAYRAAMDRFGNGLPAASDGTYKPMARYGFLSLEGYLSARAFLAILAKAGRDLTRAGFQAAAEGMGSFDLGAGVPLEFSSARHQALNTTASSQPCRRNLVKSIAWRDS
jgi:branched-chain amino acid transport system substrate-binding protein